MVSEIAAAQLLRKPVVLIALTVALTVAAHASVLGVGGTAPPSALAPSASSTLLATTGLQLITTPTFTANFQAWVFADPSNTFCSGCLDFVYQFTDNGPQENQRYSMSSFAGFMVDAGTNPFGSHDPNTVSRSGTNNGDVVSFNFDQFGNGVVPGETTVQLVIETNALHFMPGFLSAQDGQAGNGVAFQPTAVPEPTTLMLLGTGVAGLAALLRRKKTH